MLIGFLFGCVVPDALALIMLSVGLAVTLADFRRVFQRPKAFVIGILCQIIC